MSTTAVLGAGTSELVAAAYLVRAGHDVLVLDEGNACRDSVGWIPPRVVRELDLQKHGFRSDHAEPLPLSMLHADANKWPAFCERMSKLANVLEAIYIAPPPDPLTQSLRGYASLARLALRARGLGAEGMEDLLRLMPISAADFLDEWFEGDELKGALAAIAVRDLAMGPRSGGTAFNLLHQHVGSPPGVFLPMRSNAAAILRAILAPQIREACVASIEVRRSAVVGVRLASGEVIDTAAVVSGADPRRTLTELVDPGWFDPELVRAVCNVRARGVAAHMNVTFETAANNSMLIAPASLGAIERAYDDWKYGAISQEPVMFGLIKPGEKACALDVQYVPHDLAETAAEAARTKLRDRAAALFSARVDARIAAIDIQLPQDLARLCGYPQGQPNHAELALDQLFWMRPVPQLAQYRTPIPGLYLCGPAMHPGIPALTGANAARVVARELKRT